MNTALLQDDTRRRQIIERIPQGRFGNADDFKGAVVYLASNASNYVNGEVLVVDGGWMGKSISFYSERVIGYDRLTNQIFDFFKRPLNSGSRYAN
jgi:hypothetical protein